MDKQGTNDADVTPLTCIFFSYVDPLHLGCHISIVNTFGVKPVKNLNLNFSEKGKTVICQNSPEGKRWDFSTSRMMKRISPLESSHKI